MTISYKSTTCAEPYNHGIATNVITTSGDTGNIREYLGKLEVGFDLWFVQHDSVAIEYGMSVRTTDKGSAAASRCESSVF